MPNFERAVSTGKSSVNSYSYDKLFATVRGSSGSSALERANKISVSIKDVDSYNHQLNHMTSGEYKNTAGCDLSAIFMPFQTKVGPSGGMPGFNSVLPSGGKNYSQANFFNLLPFEWSSGNLNVIKDRWHSPSGDSLSHLVSAEKLYIDTNQYRDTNDIRSIGLRLPAIGVGWGFTKNGIPWPSGSAPAGQQAGVHYPSGAKFFKGGKLDGYELDPSDYVAAPIDLRYDEEKHVWSAFSSKGMWARLSSSTWVSRPGGTSGLAWSWTEVVAGESGVFNDKINGKFGDVNNPTNNTNNLGPAYEVNEVYNIDAGNVVWIEYEENKKYWVFSWHLPKSTSRFQVLQVLDNVGTIGYDWPRFH